MYTCTTDKSQKHLLKSKLHLLPWFVLCWVFLLILCPYCQIQVTHQSNQLTKNEVIQHTGMLQTHTQIKRTLLPKLLFRVKATLQGSMTIFLQLCQTCSIKLTAFLLTLQRWSLKTQSFLPCTNVLCNRNGSNDSSGFCRDVIIYCACMLSSVTESKSHWDSPTTTGYYIIQDSPFLH